MTALHLMQNNMQFYIVSGLFSEEKKWRFDVMPEVNQALSGSAK